MIKKYLPSILTVLFTISFIANASAREEQVYNHDIYVTPSKITYGNDPATKVEIERDGNDLVTTFATSDGSAFAKFLNGAGTLVASMSDLGIVQSALVGGFVMSDVVTFTDTIYLNATNTVSILTGATDNYTTKLDNSGFIQDWFAGDSDGTSDKRIVNSNGKVIHKVSSDGLVARINETTSTSGISDNKCYQGQGVTPNITCETTHVYTNGSGIVVDTTAQGDHPALELNMANNDAQRPDLPAGTYGNAPFMRVKDANGETWVWYSSNGERTQKIGSYRWGSNATTTLPRFQRVVYQAGTIMDRLQTVVGTFDTRHFATNTGMELITSAGFTSGLKLSTLAGDLILNPFGNFIANGFTFPSTDGTVGQILQTNGSDVISIGDITTAVISDFDTEVSNNTDVAANTAHSTGDGSDHSGVALLAGRSGGQTLIGSTLTGENLTLHSNTLKNGLIEFGDNSAFDEDDERLIIGELATLPSGDSLWASTKKIMQVDGTFLTNSVSVASSASTGHRPLWRSMRSRGTHASKTAVISGDVLGDFFFSGHDGTNYVNATAIYSSVDGTVSAGIVPTKIEMQITDATGFRSSAISIRSTKNVGFGILTPTARFHAKGSGNDSGTDTFILENSDGDKIVRVRDDEVIDLIGGVRQKRTKVLTSPYNILINDSHISVDLTTPAASTVNLPALSVAWDATNGVGSVFTIKDAKGDAGTNNITIAEDGADSGSIDGLSTAQITSNYGAIQVIATSPTTWEIF